MRLKTLLPFVSMMAFSALAEPVFITNSSVTGLDAKSASKIIQARSNAFPDGSPFVIGTLPFSNNQTSKLYDELIGKSSKRIEQVWTKKQFSGKGVVPREFANSEELLLWVSSTKGAIAVIDSEQADSTVQVIR